MSLRLHFAAGFAMAGHVIPAAAKAAGRMYAVELFNIATSRIASQMARNDPEFRPLLSKAIELSIERAGYDSKADNGYIAILRLRGGRQEFRQALASPAP